MTTLYFLIHKLKHFLRINSTRWELFPDEDNILYRIQFCSHCRTIQQKTPMGQLPKGWRPNRQ